MRLGEYVAKRTRAPTRAVYRVVRASLHRRALRRSIELGRALPEPPLRIDLTPGFAVLEAEQLAGVPEAVREAQSLFAARGVDAPLTPRKNTYLQHIPIASALHLDSALLRLALDATLLYAATEYLGALPVLSSLFCMHSPNVALAVDRYNSQAFHLDHDDTKQLKVFVYASEVTRDSGPFHIIDAGRSRVLEARTRYHYRCPLGDETVQRLAGHPREIVGKAGTVIVADTSRCFHMGSRPGASARLTIGMQYLHPLAFELPSGWPKGELAHLARPGLGALINHVLGDARVH